VLGRHQRRTGTHNPRQVRAQLHHVVGVGADETSERLRQYGIIAATEPATQKRLHLGQLRAPSGARRVTAILYTLRSASLGNGGWLPYVNALTWEVQQGGPAATW
jgi:hypothetical protein